MERPAKECDIIMKGGITSGVVYPSAVAQLAKRFRFRSVGGTSAGAIAAAVTAAAEYGRREGSGGFAELESLPEWLGQRAPNGYSNLFNLFVPDGATRPLFDVCTAPMRAQGPPLWLMLRSAVAHTPWGVALGALPGALLVALALFHGPGPLAALSLVAGLVCAGVGSLSTLLYRFYRLADKAIPETFLGLTTGHSASSTDGASALTDWLAELIDRCAGVSAGEKPLTFGDLWGDDPTEHDIELQMLTTNVTQGRPYRLPFETRTFYFDREEFRRLFPAKVYRWLLACAATHTGGQNQRYLPLPEAKDLPLVVAARLSLSYPLLIGAVPLYAIDFTRVKPKDRVLTRCWFTDGGITCNFPVHFFDRPLPRRPTFTINLRTCHPDYGPESDDFRDTHGVWMPKTNRDGIHAVWNYFDDRRGLGKLGGFLQAALDTGFSWRDALLLGFPGYRDRVVHISLSPTEGDLNLNMPAETIEALSERGTRAGALLSERFGDTPPEGVTLTWDNHRWVRYRAYIAALESHLRALREGYMSCSAGQRPYVALLQRPTHDPPSSYRLRRQGKRGKTQGGQYVYAQDLTCGLLNLAETVAQSEDDLQNGAPKPRPVLRIVPDI